MDSLEKLQDDEVTLPKATIDKIISEVLKKKHIQKDVKELVGLSVLEFIHLITSEANDLCEKDNKKTITHEHVYSAFENLGYKHYIEECEGVYEEHVKISKMKPGKINKLKESGLTMDELYRTQMTLFENAKKAYQGERKSEEEELQNEK